jgi:hypothetical protein
MKQLAGWGKQKTVCALPLAIELLHLPAKPAGSFNRFSSSVTIRKNPTPGQWPEVGWGEGDGTVKRDDQSAGCT